MKKGRLTAHVAVLVACMGVTGLGLAQARKVFSPQVPALVYSVESMLARASGQCVEAGAAASQSATTSPATLRACTGAQSQQSWRWMGVGKNKQGRWDTFVFQNKASLQCLGVDQRSGKSGAGMVMLTCDFADASQMWMRTVNVSYGDGRASAPPTQWINIHSGLCLTASKAAGKTSALLQSPCTSSYARVQQEFSVRGLQK